MSHLRDRDLQRFCRVTVHRRGDFEGKNRDRDVEIYELLDARGGWQSHDALNDVNIVQILVPETSGALGLNERWVDGDGSKDELKKGVFADLDAAKAVPVMKEQIARLLV
ncbi:hypothetical protein CLAFUW4_13938 [Fulvia fulva]|uniref:Uncharacterized protein n=1 Tax=Passalora fulva TaxID=5499 RepID=A0A9Q8PLU4_PASFU|nr:uncharacterized protein CLAFUR5_13780 [Fulvia fulva]KAK4610523.1 hypothetical protein CLAFUR4_13941 [Fulvia fulva]KAK4611058.1 hypothetical protein CLAFUR0_13945 [Fulvia fulva]UJO24757.1 hypothetical protein CLAFUR5_13780 [Fulvia fulva]WPV22332.1 hypothetical protein CLAFUW4_13938 [Fulvia fulva]WPV36703.1 hypothetical protein CLAFUW7_13946 [Fulvia fulva]